MPRVYPTGHLIEEFPIKLRNGRTLKGMLYQTARATGRRLKVIDPAGAEAAEPVFDSDDCYDLGNATNKLDFWIAANDTPPPDMLARFVAGYEPPAVTSIERTYYDFWRLTQAGPPLVCDVCKQVMDAEDQGQRTADTVACSPCVVKARNAAREQMAAEGRTTPAGDIAHELTNLRLLGLVQPPPEVSDR